VSPTPIEIDNAFLKGTLDCPGASRSKKEIIL